MFVHRTIWISDFHLGTRQCKSERLLTFLETHRSDYLYLVGDILDTWNLGKGWYFDEVQQQVVKLILSKAKESKVYLFSGNHDEASITHLMDMFPGLPILESQNHITAMGKKLLVVHGHQFDSSFFRASSDLHFSLAMKINQWYHENSGPVRTFLANLAIKLTNPRQKTFFKNIQRSLDTSYSGIVCGHVHIPVIKDLGRLTYYNDGDWVENCTALIEDFTGDIRLI